MSLRALALMLFLGIALCGLLLSCAAVREELGLAPVGGEEGAVSEEDEWGVEETETAAPSYATDIQPIFEANCTRCHGTRRQEKKLNLKSYSGAMARGVILAGDASGSTLYQKISLEGPGRMPSQSDPLPDEEIQKIKQWIDAGAKEE